LTTIEQYAEKYGVIPIKARYKNEPDLQPNAKSMFGVGAAKLRDSKKNLRNY